MHRTLALLLLLTGCASAAKKQAACAPVPAEFLSYGEVHAECAVDQRARVVSVPRPDFSRLEPLATGSSGCYRVDYDMVVDEKGSPIARSIKLYRTNSPSFANTIEPTIPQVRFEPARKNGVPVAQLVRWGTGLAYTVSRTGTGPRRPPLC